jgi:ABC-2 type transport system permease protein
MNALPLFALVRKDLRLFLHDRRAVILSFAAPLMLASLFSAVGGGGDDGGVASAIKILVVDQDDSQLSKEVLKGLESDKNLDPTTTSLERARSQVRNGQFGVAVVIPNGFGAKATSALFRGEDRPEITFLRDPTHSAEAGMVRGMMMQHVMEAVSKDAFGGPGGIRSLKESMDWIEKTNDGDVPPAMRQAIQSMYREILKVNELARADEPADARSKSATPRYAGFSAPFEVREELLAAPGQAQKGMMAAHSFAGMAVQFILFGSIEAGVALLLERQKGLWRRLRAAPISRFTLLAAKAISQAIISLLIVLVVFGFGVAVFHIRFSGNILGFVLVALGYCLVASTFGLLIAAIGKTPQAARGVSVLAVLLLVMLGGAWIPTFMFPPWLQRITPLIPTRWAIDGFEGATFRGAGLGELLVSTAALLGFAILFGGLALARFRWEED